MTEPIVSLSEAQAFVRVETGEEEALLAGFIRSASALCERFLNQVVVVRPFAQTLTVGQAWTRLAETPVVSITAVFSLEVTGVATLLPPGDYAVDVDAQGDGWVRLPLSGQQRLRVEGTAGMAADVNGVPEPIRQGVLRLVAHMFASRDHGGGEPPAAVTALWRPYRRMQLA